MFIKYGCLYCWPPIPEYLTWWHHYSGFVFFSSLYYLPQFFQVALGYSPIDSGVFLLPVLVSQSFASCATVCIFLYGITAAADHHNRAERA